MTQIQFGPDAEPVKRVGFDNRALAANGFGHQRLKIVRAVCFEREKNFRRAEHAAAVIALETRLAELEQALADGATDDRTLAAHGKAQGRPEPAGGSHWRERAIAALVGHHLAGSEAGVGGGDARRGADGEVRRRRRFGKQFLL